MPINVRLYPVLWACPENPLASGDMPAYAPTRELGEAGPVNPLPALSYLDLDPLPTDESGNVPGGGGGGGGVTTLYGNQPGWVTVRCDLGLPDNSVSVFMLPNRFFATGQGRANQLASDFYAWLALTQIACNNAVICISVLSIPIYEVLPLDQECAGGYWFSEPMPDLVDDFVINQPQA